MANVSASTAVVLSVSGQTVTVALGDSGEGGTDVLQKLRHVSCAAGDLAHISTVGRARFVDGVIGAGNAPSSDPPLEVPPPAPQDISTGSWSFGPIDPGTWRDGAWRQDTTLLWQGVFGSGEPQYGVAWYAEGPSALPGSLTGAALTLERVQGPSGLVTPTVALYAGAGRVGDDAPVVLDSQVGPPLALGEPQDWTLPDAWLPLLQDGSAGGLGCYLPSVDPALALSAEGSGMSLVCYWSEG